MSGAGYLLPMSRPGSLVRGPRWRKGGWRGGSRGRRGLSWRLGRPLKRLGGGQGGGSTSQQSVSGRYSGKSDAVTARASGAGARDGRLCQLLRRSSLHVIRAHGKERRRRGRRRRGRRTDTPHPRGISIGRHKEKEPMGGSETGDPRDREQVASISASDSHTKGDRK